MNDIYYSDDNGKMACGFHFEKLNSGRSDGREATDTKRLKMRNGRKLCEFLNMYHIDDNGRITFGYTHHSAYSV